ncbi:MAG: RES family NAD+ phosphorylase [Chloroflexi bacterium]|nr:RES family NAD+ phosphorylase [Chloroflexota bacterium]
MVRIPPPEFGRAPRDPIVFRVPAGTPLFRIFDPTQQGATASGFRFHGPHSRFDHHRGLGPPAYEPGDDLERGVYYAAFTLSSCVVEVFGDQGSLTLGEQRIAKPALARELCLLDLRGPGAMRAGSVAALAKVADRSLSQAWARRIYEHPDLFGPVDGILYANAHNDEDALVLFERAVDTLICPPTWVVRLDDPYIRAFLEDIARTNNLVFL